jgi:hypothetical protein
VWTDGRERANFMQTVPQFSAQSVLGAGLFLVLGVALAPAAPSAPTGLVASGETNQVRLDWNNNSEPDLAGYHVYRSLSAGGPYTRLDGTVTLIKPGSVWRYHDTGVDLGTAWHEPAFNDSGWAAGPAPLGYGDGDEATVVSYGPDPNNKYPTCYFRQTFVLDEPALFTELEVYLQRDDGAAVYLNGVEIIRDNMPAGTITYASFASSAVGNATENIYYQYVLSPSLLVPGPNVLAVEVHQATAASADLSFDLYVTGLTGFGKQLLQSIPTSTATADKPQSKVWQHGNKWWMVLPDSTGTWVWRLDQASWAKVLKLSSTTTFKADCKPNGDVTHLLLYNGTSSRLASIQYLPGWPGSYRLWPTRTNLATVSLSSGVETATIDLDSTGRMWLASDAVTNIQVRYSDSPYASWSAPITLASGVSSDDICVVTRLPNGTVGLLWSDQVRRRFGFRVHLDGDNPSRWSADEVPASQSALNVGLGMADDHLNVAVASDGTLYAAVKTSYDTTGYPKIALLVRRPAGTWDPLYAADQNGTRPIVVLSEDLDRLMVIYAASEGLNNIVCKVSSTAAISFGPRQMFLAGSNNDVSSTKQNVAHELVALASSGTALAGVRTPFAWWVNPLASELVDTAVTPGLTYYYVATAENTLGQESTFSNEATATPLSAEPPPSPIALATALAFGPGSVAGTIENTSSADGVEQKITETSTGAKSRAGLIAEYTLVTAISRARITGLTLQFKGSWTSLDAGESLIAAVWNNSTSGWDLLGWTVGSTRALFMADLSDAPLNYVDLSGQIRVRFVDSREVEREKKDTLGVDLLVGLVASGP